MALRRSELCSLQYNPCLQGAGLFRLTDSHYVYKNRCDECDEYACKAYECCNAFSDDTIDSCIRGCLITFHKRNCEKLTNPELKRVCVAQAHYDCYSRCNGDIRGAGRLVGKMPEECKEAMDWVGGMWPDILYPR